MVINRPQSDSTSCSSQSLSSQVGVIPPRLTHILSHHHSPIRNHQAQPTISASLVFLRSSFLLSPGTSAQRAHLSTFLRNDEQVYLFVGILSASLSRFLRGRDPSLIAHFYQILSDSVRFISGLQMAWLLWCGVVCIYFTFESFGSSSQNHVSCGLRDRTEGP